MDTISTVFTLICLVGCGGIAYAMHGSYRAMIDGEARVQREIAKLAAQKAKTLAHDEQIDSLNRQLQRLRGQFHAFRAEHELVPEIDETHGQGDANERPSLTVAQQLAAQQMHPCENYTAAQREGPFSAAAKCECNYCTLKRLERASTRERLIPKTAAAQAKLARDNSHGS